MRYLTSLLLAALLNSSSNLALADTPPDREALSQPLPGLSADEMEHFRRGRSLFRQSWVIAPAKDSEVDGLGPLYNRLACISCHAKNGRGGAPATAQERMQSMLVRLSIPGRNSDGGPKPHPAYGDQLNEEGIPGVPGEGRAHLHWQNRHYKMPDGHAVSLHKPSISFSELAYGKLEPVMTSLRVSPHVAGLGLLDAVDGKTLESLAAEKKPDGVHGMVNRVRDKISGKIAVGRFGLKANTPTLRQQIAAAFLGDMGITSPLFPEENCTETQTACSSAINGGTPELAVQQLDDVEFYLANIAPPPRRQADEITIKKGSATFSELGCAVCHRPQLKTKQVAGNQRLSDQAFAPYTDLLLHDMGKQLADKRPDHAANGRQWRTAPLWGLGTLIAINENTGFLHDGRARSIEEAILWHGGEAAKSRQRYVNLPISRRQETLDFLNSL